MRSAEWEVRKAESRDIGQIVAIVKRYWTLESIPGFDSTTLSALLDKVADDQKLGDILVASIGARIVGYLISVYVFSLEHRGLTAEIDEFFVLKEFRSIGIGSTMIDTAEQRALDAGCTNVSLQISIENARAREFYFRHGFIARSGYQLLDKELPGA